MLDSVRTRLTLWYVAVLALVLLAFSFGVYLLLARSLHHRLDAGLEAASVSVATMLERERAEGESEQQAAISAVEELFFPPQSLVVCDAAGDVLAEKNAPGLARLPLARINLSVADPVAFFSVPGEKRDDEELRIIVRRVHLPRFNANYVVVIGQSRGAVAEEMEILRHIFLLAVPLALALAGAGGWLLARRSLAPVVMMSERARRIGAENLDERLPIANPRDELGKLAATFNELLARLDSAFTGQRQFMADASHELRTPLHVIRTAADVTLELPRRAEGEYREALAMIKVQVQRLSRIVEDMFTLARADAEHRELEPADFYLDELLHETAQAARLLAAPKGVKVEVGPAEESLFRGDEGLLRQMLLNLLDNAVRHTPAGGTVSVGLTGGEEAYEITVTDTGVGIPAEAQAHVFERFYRADKARSRSESHHGQGGAGLGLSIARWVAEAHGGTIRLVRSDATGTTFTVILPRTRA